MCDHFGRKNYKSLTRSVRAPARQLPRRMPRLRFLKLRFSVPEARNVIAWGANPRISKSNGFFPTRRSAAKRPIAAWGKGIQFSNFLGFAPQAVTIRASGTKTRNLETRQFIVQ